MRRRYNELVSKVRFDKEIYDNFKINGDPLSYYDIGEAVDDVHTVAEIFSSRDKNDYSIKCNLLKKHAYRVSDAISFVAKYSGVLGEPLLEQFIKDVTRLDNFISPHVSASLKELTAVLVDQLQDIDEHDYTQRNKWSMLALKLMAYAGVYDGNLLFEITTQYVDCANKLSNNLLANLLYSFAVMHEFDDDFLAEILKVWNKRDCDDDVLINLVNKSCIMFARFKDLLPNTNRQLNFYDLLNDIGEINDAANQVAVDTSGFGSQNFVKKAVTEKAVELSDNFKLVEEKQLLDFNVDLMVTHSKFPFVYLVATDGPHHFLADTLNNDPKLTPKEQFRNDVIMLYMQAKNNQAVLYRRICVLDNMSFKAIKVLVEDDLYRLRDDAIAIERNGLHFHDVDPEQSHKKMEQLQKQADNIVQQQMRFFAARTADGCAIEVDKNIREKNTRSELIVSR